MPEYSSVKIVVTTGDVETVFDIPEAQNVVMDMIYDEPEITARYKSVVCPPTVKELTFTMKPKGDATGKYLTITRRESGEVVL